MTKEIQKILYDLISKNAPYPVYAHHSENIPCIIIHDIEVENLPYSHESHRYDEIKATITIHNEKQATKKCFEIMGIISDLLRSLPTINSNIKNLLLKGHTKTNKAYLNAEIEVTFTYINNNRNDNENTIQDQSRIS
jgi:hypothetical protein